MEGTEEDSTGIARRYGPDDYMAIRTCREMADFLSEHPNKAYVVSRRRPEFMEEAIRANWKMIGWYRRAEITPEMVMMALEQSGMALRFASEELLRQRPDLCRAAVEDSAMALKYVPEDLRDASMCDKALHSDIRAIEFVPEDLLTADACQAAVEHDASLLKYVPNRLRTKAMEDLAVSRDWTMVRLVRRRTRERLLMAFSQSPMAIQFFPRKMKTHEVCREAFERDRQTIVFFPREELDLSTVSAWLSSIGGVDATNPHTKRQAIDVLSRVSDGIISSDALRRPLRLLGLRTVEHASWVRDKCHFEIRETVSPLRGVGGNTRKVAILANPTSLDELLGLLEGDLSSVDFEGYGFDDFDPVRHDLSTARLPAETLERLGIYDDRDYRRLVKTDPSALSLMSSRDWEGAYGAALPGTIRNGGHATPTPVYYISDLHLDHKLSARFPRIATEREVVEWMDEVVRKMTCLVELDLSEKSTLVVLGDTSFNIETSRLFYSRLKREWKGPLVVMLGNHELWGCGSTTVLSDSGDRLDGIVLAYRDMLDSLGIALLQGGLFLRMWNDDAVVLDADELDAMGDGELADRLRNSKTVLLGGLGFTGLCEDFNAAHGLYRDAVTTREHDGRLSARFAALHERVRRIAPWANVVVATHTPMRCWSDEAFQPGWTYLSGHTHRNTSYESGGARVFEDGQVGYHGEDYGLRKVRVEGYTNPFCGLVDDIYVVPREHYETFLQMQGLGARPMKAEGDILLAKRGDLYLFLIIKRDNGELYLLEGRRLRKLGEQDPWYYYENMQEYGSLVRSAFTAYERAIRRISGEVMRIGGEGTVHGSIVDIDHYCHISLDPVTGRLKYYFARNVTHRREYPSLGDLILHEEGYNWRLLGGYRALLDSAGGEDATVIEGSDESVARECDAYDEVMYGRSRVMRSVQYLFDHGVIRVWNEDVLSACRRLSGSHEGPVGDSGRLGPASLGHAAPNLPPRGDCASLSIRRWRETNPGGNATSCSTELGIPIGTVLEHWHGAIEDLVAARDPARKAPPRREGSLATGEACAQMEPVDVGEDVVASIRTWHVEHAYGSPSRCAMELGLPVGTVLEYWFSAS